MGSGADVTCDAVLHTDRLILRTFRPEDLVLYAKVNEDPAVAEFLRGHPFTAAMSDDMACGANDSFVQRGFGKLAIERRVDGAFLGMCGLSIEPWFPHDLEIGWRLAGGYWGFGYATEAAAAWLKYAFDQLRARRVISVADVPNPRSIAVMRRIGLQFEHAPTLSDENGKFEAVVYSMDAALSDGIVKLTARTLLLRARHKEAP